MFQCCRVGRPKRSLSDPDRPDGYVKTLFSYMPAVNNYDIGDGLNVAGHRWIRRRDGGENLFDAGEPSDRKQWNVKIDHIFNQSHKISGAWSFEKDYASDAFMAWPGTWEGKDYNQPQVLTVNFVSTIVTPAGQRSAVRNEPDGDQ